jgi:hypothetical protein
VNKTGGSSVVAALNMLQAHMSAELLFSDDELKNDDQYRLWQGWRGGKRITTRNWEPLENIKNYWDEYLKFTIVRNPWDRAVSDFHYCKKHNLVDDSVIFQDDVRSTIDSRERWKLPCHDWLALNGKVAVDRIIRFEKLNEGFGDLCKELGIPDIKLPHLNKTKHTHYTDYYDDDLRDLVAEKYAKDIEVFGYEFGD